MRQLLLHSLSVISSLCEAECLLCFFSAACLLSINTVICLQAQGPCSVCTVILQRWIRQKDKSSLWGRGRLVILCLCTEVKPDQTEPQPIIGARQYLCTWWLKMWGGKKAPSFELQLTCELQVCSIMVWNHWCDNDLLLAPSYRVIP